MGGADDSRLLGAVLEALPFAAAVVTRRGEVVAQNTRFGARSCSAERETGFTEVAVGVGGHRLLFAENASTLSVGLHGAIRRYGFTRRETQVLEHLLEGVSSRTIAARLDLGVRTVESHIARLLEKSECESRGELIARVFQSMLGGPRTTRVQD